MRRHWVKLWVNEWLDGTTRFQMTGAQRAFWIDLLAMAGRSRFPGIICSGRDGENFVGYPLMTFAALDTSAELDLQATFELFVATGKIALEVTAEKPVRLFKVAIANWSKYQSEYQRQKPYQETYRQKGRKLSNDLTPELSPNLVSNYLLEGEVRREKEKKTTPAPNAGAVIVLPDWLPVESWNAFLEMRKKLRKPLTTAAVKLAIKRLGDLRSAGDDPKAVLEQSVLNGYQGLFEIRTPFATREERDRAQRHVDAAAGRYDPEYKPRKQTPGEEAEIERTRIEVERWKGLDDGTLAVGAETVTWAKEKLERLRKVPKLPVQDRRPAQLSSFLKKAREAHHEAV